MVAAVGVNATQGQALVAVTLATAGLRATQAYTLTAINFPTPFDKVTQALIQGTVKSVVNLRTAQAFVLAAVRGRVANPRLRAWTFTLDGHDFYVLRLGDAETLVYDLSTKQWVNWDSLGTPFWRANTGFSWVGGQALAHQYGSNIIVGDDTWGLLWLLDPEQPFDEHSDDTNPVQQLEFSRIVTGQFAQRGREVQPCNTIFLAGDNYGIAAVDFTASVALEYSDDAGQTYVSAGALGVDQLSYSWRSLGQISAPGRMFKITDNGVFTRIDDMKMNDD